MSEADEKRETGVPAEATSAEEAPAPAEAPPVASEVAGAAPTEKSEPTPTASEPAAEAKADAKKSRARPKARHPVLVRAFRAGRAVEGTIEKVIKGGYEVRVGRARAFCPHSQIDLHREDEPERQVGKTYEFKITQLRRGGEDVVLSRRAMLEADRVEEAKAVRATLIEGHVMQGRVVSIAAFGAFVDLGAGVLGLVHVSELSHNRVRSVDEVVKVGEAVPVRILKLKEPGRISLSIRRAQDDPWEGIAERFEIGKSYPGTVQRVADFGAFVELAPGVEALAPASEFPPKSGGWKDGLDVGGSHEWCVLSVDAKERRVSVALPGDGAGSAAAVVVGAELAGQVQRVERYGVFVWLAPGRVGLMPREMTGEPDGADLRRSFHIGDGVDVNVVEIEGDGRRIRLCKKGVQVDAPPERPSSRGVEREPEEPQTFGTSLADKLRAALGQNEPGS